MSNGNDDGKWMLAFWIVTIISGICLITMTAALYAETTNRVTADQDINSGRARARIEIDREVLDLRKETGDKFEVILQRLSSIEAVLKHEWK